ncbi:MAG TPA: hypothetical protein VF779_18570 [Pyrinomonadaceae bacterium]
MRRKHTSLTYSVEADLFLYGAQCVNHKADVLVQINAQLRDSLPNVIAVDRARKGFVL